MPRWLTEFWNTLRFAGGNGRKQNELEAEMEFHIAETIDDLVEQGIDPDEARKVAIREFGGVEQIKEDCRDSWGVHVMTDWIRDLRFGVRLLLKNRGFSLAVLLTLGLCIGGNTIVFSILKEALGPPPYPDSDRVVEVYNNYAGGMGRKGSSIPVFLDYKENTDVFEFLTLISSEWSNLSTDSVTTNALGLLVSADYFKVFQFSPLVGQFFEEDHFVHGNSGVVVLTESFWRSNFASDPEVIGKTLIIDAKQVTIIGVAPSSASLQYGDPNSRYGGLDYFRAWNWSPKRVEFETVTHDLRHNNYAGLWGKLKKESSRIEAKSQIDASDRHYLEEVAVQATRNWLISSQHETRLETEQETKISEIGSSLYLLQGGVLAVLLIGCVNVLNLQISRGLGRLPEHAMRKSLGASPWGLLRQILIENMVLAIACCLLGLLIVVIGMGWVDRFFLQEMLPGVSEARIETSSLLFAAVLSAIVCLFLGFFSTLSIFKADLTAVVQLRDRKLTQSKSLSVFRSALIAGQIAMTLVLLLISGLLLQSFYNALNGDLGMEPRNVTATHLWLPHRAYPEREKLMQFYDQLRQSISESHGVESVAYTAYLPGVNAHFTGMVRVPDYEIEYGKNISNVHFNVVSLDYFEILGIPILLGSSFSSLDMAGDSRNTIVDRAFVERYFPDSNPIGKHFNSGSKLLPTEEMRTIIGVVESVKHAGLDVEGSVNRTHSGNTPLVYTPMSSGTSNWNLYILVESQRRHEDILSLLRGEIKNLDPKLPISFSAPLDSLMRDSLNDRRAFMLVIIILGCMALLLSVVGMYGVIAYDVSQRTREIGIRMAIGASGTVILRHILKRGMVSMGIGLSIGLVGAWLLSDRLAEFLYLVSPTEPVAYVGISVFLAVVAMLASYLPARRATRIVPTEALRVE